MNKKEIVVKTGIYYTICGVSGYVLGKCLNWIWAKLFAN